MKWLAYTIGIIVTVFFFALGLWIVLSPDVVTESCYTSHSQSWAFLPLLGGLIFACATAVAAWDDGR